ncbi:MAG: hypothetical protein K9M15_02810 [Candidatus Marinimicrobia bacterium]|nr:hypothetical protein [Candidatus Neomarinimicrobiota bacterium]
MKKKSLFFVILLSIFCASLAFAGSMIPQISLDGEVTDSTSQILAKGTHKLPFDGDCKVDVKRIGKDRQVIDLDFGVDGTVDFRKVEQLIYGDADHVALAKKTEEYSGNPLQLRYRMIQEDDGKMITMIIEQLCPDGVSVAIETGTLNKETYEIKQETVSECPTP